MMPFNPSPFPTFPEPPFKDEEVNAVTFVSVDEPVVLSTVAEAVKAAEQAAAQAPIRVRVQGNYRIVHEGKPYVSGDRLTVPADVAGKWIKAGWVEPVPKRGTK
jgi:hypothetical protein